MKLPIFSLALVLLATSPVIVGCAEAEAGSASTTGANNITSAPAHVGSIDVDRGRISFVPPTGWEDISELVPAGMRAFGEPDAVDFASNVNVLCVDWDAGSRRALVRGIRDAYSLMFNDYTLEGDGTLDLGDGEAWWVEGSMTQGVFHIHNLQVFVRRADKCYTFTYTALASEYPRLREVFFNSARTIKTH